MSLFIWDGEVCNIFILNGYGYIIKLFFMLLDYKNENYNFLDKKEVLNYF
uniref:Uncharacterized protein n=1 Tax=viral metagenome TaxID=1070528 RepID=A0A6C0AE18_9ZZZZ